MASPCLQELLNQMNQQKVRPDLLTFNSVLKALRRCGFLAKTQALHTLNEMKALGIGNTAIRVLLPGVLQASLIFFSECVCVCVQLPAWPPTTTSWQSFTNQVALQLLSYVTLTGICAVCRLHAFKCAFTPCVSSPASSAQNNTDLLQEVIAELEGRIFTCQDPDDGISRRTTDLANVSFCLGRTNVRRCGW